MSDIGPSVVVLGSLHYDIMVEAPDRPRKGETVTGRRWAPKCGGKGGNQAVAAARQGVATAMVSAVGRDAFGAALLANLEAAGVDRTRVATRGDASGMSVAILDDEGDYGAVIVSGANLAIEAGQLEEALWSSAKVLVLQNEVPESVNAAAARQAHGHGVTTILNAAPARPFASDLPTLIDILVVNAVEAEMLGGGAVASLDDALAAAQALARHFAAVLVTAGGAGLAFADAAGRTHRLAGIPVVVASTHGAGDAFVGTLAAALAQGHDLAAALDRANRTAAALVATPEAARS